MCCVLCCFFFFQAEDGIRDLVRSRGLGDVYKRQARNGRHGHVYTNEGKLNLFNKKYEKDTRPIASDLSLIHI